MIIADKTQEVGVSSEEYQRDKPEIKQELDVPFGIEDKCNNTKNQRSETIGILEISQQEHEHWISNLKYSTAKKLIYICIGGIALFALIDAFFNLNSSMFNSAFEVFKLIAMTVLGYTFGEKSIKK